MNAMLDCKLCKKKIQKLFLIWMKSFRKFTVTLLLRAYLKIFPVSPEYFREEPIRNLKNQYVYENNRSVFYEMYGKQKELNVFVNIENLLVF